MKIRMATRTQDNPIDFPIIVMVAVDVVDVFHVGVNPAVKRRALHGADVGLSTIRPPHAALCFLPQALTASRVARRSAASFWQWEQMKLSKGVSPVRRFFGPLWKWSPKYAQRSHTPHW
jgi:hypothetical protein